jgi:molybdenum cofactor cytidylyltransferase
MELKHKSTAAIILAAGGSKRLGKPKQLLDWFGKPFINRVVDTALSAQLTPVIVVTGSNDDLFEKNLRGNEIEIVFNANWQAGQSTSLIAGVKELQKFKVPQFLFLLVDMPQVTEKWLIEILSHAEIDDSDIITTTVNGEVTPPILFKENCFKRN